MTATGQWFQLGPYHHLGSLLTNGKLYHYAAGTDTLKDLWLDYAKTIAVNQPMIADANGVFTFFGDGLYKLVLTDEYDSPINTWPNVAIGEAAAVAFTPGLTFGGAATGMAGAMTGLSVLRGPLCYVSLNIVLTAKGSATGAAVLTGLPSTALAANDAGHLAVTLTNGGSLTSQVLAAVVTGSTTAGLYDTSASAATTLTEGNFTDTTDLRVSGWYLVA